MPPASKKVPPARAEGPDRHARRALRTTLQAPEVWFVQRAAHGRGESVDEYLRALVVNEIARLEAERRVAIHTTPGENAWRAEWRS